MSFSFVFFLSRLFAVVSSVVMWWALPATTTPNWLAKAKWPIKWTRNYLKPNYDEIYYILKTISELLDDT